MPEVIDKVEPEGRVLKIRISDNPDNSDYYGITFGGSNTSKYRIHRQLLQPTIIPDFPTKTKYVYKFCVDGQEYIDSLEKCKSIAIDYIYKKCFKDINEAEHELQLARYCDDLIACVEEYDRSKVFYIEELKFRSPSRSRNTVLLCAFTSEKTNIKIGGMQIYVVYDQTTCNITYSARGFEEPTIEQLITKLLALVKKEAIKEKTHKLEQVQNYYFTPFKK